VVDIYYFIPGPERNWKKLGTFGGLKIWGKDWITLVNWGYSFQKTKLLVGTFLGRKD